jgi:hypothetical protein
VVYCGQGAITSWADLSRTSGSFSRSC